MIKEQLGKRIYELRKQMNISQEELAEKLEISQRSLSKIETGQNFVKSNTLEKLLTAFDISCNELFNFEHLNTSENLIDEIYKNIGSIKNNDYLVVILYKITKALAQK